MDDSSTEKKQRGWRIDVQLARNFKSICAGNDWTEAEKVEEALRDWMAKIRNQKRGSHGSVTHITEKETRG